MFEHIAQALSKEVKEERIGEKFSGPFTFPAQFSPKLCMLSPIDACLKVCGSITAGNRVGHKRGAEIAIGDY